MDPRRCVPLLRFPGALVEVPRAADTVGAGARASAVRLDRTTQCARPSPTTTFHEPAGGPALQGSGNKTFVPAGGPALQGSGNKTFVYLEYICGHTPPGCGRPPGAARRRWRSHTPAGGPVRAVSLRGAAAASRAFGCPAYFDPLARTWRGLGDPCRTRSGPVLSGVVIVSSSSGRGPRLHVTGVGFSGLLHFFPPFVQVIYFQSRGPTRVGPPRRDVPLARTYGRVVKLRRGNAPWGPLACG